MTPRTGHKRTRLVGLLAGLLLLAPTPASGAPQNRNADLVITGTEAPDPATVGGELTYSFQVANGGPAAAKAVTFSDTIPDRVDWISTTVSQGSCTGERAISCSLGALEASATATVTVVVRPSASGSITNTATVDTGQPDPDSSNNAVSLTTAVADPPPVTEADVEVLNVGGSGRGTFLGTLYAVTITATVRNNGPSAANSVSVRISGASNLVATSDRGVCTGGTCTIPVLAAGESSTIRAVGTYTSPYSGSWGSWYTYADASIHAAEHDPVLGNNEAIGYVGYYETPDHLPDVCGTLCF